MKKVASALNAPVTVEVLAPSLTSAISAKRSVTVSERRDVVEIPDISRDDISGDTWSLVPVSFDFAAEHLHLRFLSSGRAANVGPDGFNGYRIQWDLPSGLSIRSFQIARSSLAVTSDKISRVATNTIAINLNDLAFAQGKGLSLIFGFSCSGSSEDDELTGAQGPDAINGLAGNDLIEGGRGRDLLTGGTGQDTFVIGAIGSKNVDRVTDFERFNDKFLLDFTTFQQLPAGELAWSQFGSNSTGVATTSLQRVLYATQSGQLFYDPDGSGPLARQLFALIGTNQVLSASNFVVA